MNCGNTKNGGEFSASSDVNIFDRLFYLTREKQEENSVADNSRPESKNDDEKSSNSSNKTSVDPIAQKKIKQEEIDEDISIVEESQSTLQIIAPEKEIRISPMDVNNEEPVVPLASRFVEIPYNRMGFVPLSNFSIDTGSLFLTTNQKNIRLNRLAGISTNTNKNVQDKKCDDDSFTLIEMSHCDAIWSASAVKILEKNGPWKDNRGQQSTVNQSAIQALDKVEEHNYQPVRPSQPIVKVKRHRKQRSDLGEKHKKRKLLDDVESMDDVLDVWEAKLELQLACGFGASENLHVKSLIQEAMNRIESLEYQRTIAVATSLKLLREQKKLLFRLIKPMSSTKGKRNNI